MPPRRSSSGAGAASRSPPRAPGPTSSSTATGARRLPPTGRCARPCGAATSPAGGSRSPPGASSRCAPNWQDERMGEELSAAEAAARVRPSDTLGLPLGPGQPPAFMAALGERDDWEDLHVYGALL